MEQNREPRNNPMSLQSLIFDQGNKLILWASDNLFNKWYWENWTGTCRKMKLDYLLTPHRRINSKLIKDLNVGLETIRSLEENIGNKVLDTVHWKYFFQVYLPRQGKQEKK